MKNFRPAFYASLLIALASSLVHAQQSTRTWVSTTGDDANVCSSTSPCKTFAGAISKTNTGGEIDVLNSGGFGAVSILKSITIDGTGALALITAAAGNGITINLQDPADVAKSVRLRGLSINGFGTGANGISIVAAQRVSVENCVIDGFSQNGMLVASGRVFIRNTTIRNNTLAGVSASTGGGSVGLYDVALIFNGATTAAEASSLIWFTKMVTFGNTRHLR